MMDFREKFEDLVDDLHEERQALRAKLHVVKLDALESWDKLEERFENLKGDRDELRVKAHLAKMEMLDEWERLEDKFENLKGRAGHFTEASEEKLTEAWEAAKGVGDEIRAGLTKIRSRF